MQITRLHIALVALVGALALTSPAAAQVPATGPSPLAHESQLRPPRPCLRQSPVFSLEAKLRRSYGAEVHLNDPRARCSRLDRVEVEWGDGTREIKELNPLALYTRVGLDHRYPRRPTATPYPVRVTLHDEDGMSTTRTAQVWVWAEYRLTLRNLRFTAQTDCDPVGEGDFEIYFRFDNYQGDRSFAQGVGRRSVDLGAGESVTIADRLDYLATWAPGSRVELTAFVTEDDPNQFNTPRIASFDLFPRLRDGHHEFRGHVEDCAVMTSYDLTAAPNL